MGVYNGDVLGITPSNTDDNWILSAGASEIAWCKEANWGGEAVTTTAMRTRVARASGQAGALTVGNVAKGNPFGGTNVISFGTTFATTQPTLDAGDLFAQSWNAHGGVVRQLLDPEEEWILIGAATETLIVCRNALGTGVSSYGVAWRE